MVHDDGARASLGSESGLRDPDALVGRTVAGKYEVHEVLAKGGMGRIYRATQVPLGRPVALKVLHDELDEGADSGFQKRFLLEAASCARLRHPNIVVVYDYGKLTETERGAYFMAMEMIEGPTLGQVLREGPMPAARALKIAREVARALREAHRQEMVHRDLKPSNVMIVATGEGEQVKVLDFGLVKVMRDDSEELTKEGHFLGSPKYMAPEQIKRMPVDGRADLYALGVLLYHMLAGRVPFEGDQAVQTLMAHLNDPVPPLPVRADLTPAVAQIVMRCLEKEPELRFRSADVLIRAIDEAATGVPGWSAEMALVSTSGESVLSSGESTLSSSGTIPRGVVVHGQPAPAAPARRPMLAGLAVIALAALAAVVLALALPADDPPPAPVAAPTPPVLEPPPHEVATRFTLFVASTPPGATVTRDGAAVGVTPTFVQLESAPLEDAPARFELTLAGHATHVFTQGPSREDVHVTAELQPVPAIATPQPPEPPELQPGAPQPQPEPRVTRRRAPRERPTGETPATGEDNAIKTRR